MRTVTHREMRNQSGEILRQVAAGETVQVTNHGRIAALIVPPGGSALDELAARGQVREASQPTSTLASIKRRRISQRSEAILRDLRGG